MLHEVEVSMIEKEFWELADLSPNPGSISYLYMTLAS